MLENREFNQKINWFPGHMAKTRRKLQEDLKFVDIVLEIIDSRIPNSSRNPDLEQIISNKPRLLILNKSDMSDGIETKKWLNFYKNKELNAISFSVSNKEDPKKFYLAVKNILKEKIKNWGKKGIKSKKLRAMVVGIPNVGKSSFINRLVGNKKAKVQNKPGVTRINQWFLVGKEIELLDTPGVLQPKIESHFAAKNLAFTGAIKDDILNLEELASDFLETLSINYVENLTKRYKLEEKDFLGLNSFRKLEIIGRKRGILISGGKVDTEKTAKMILTDFRNLKLGRITLEFAQ